MKVLIFKSETSQNGVVISGVSFFEDVSYPMSLNFDQHRIIGTAKLSRDENGDIWADLDIEAPVKDMWEFHKADFYPALGGDIDGSKMILWPSMIGLCTNPNCDPRIPSFKIE